MKNTGKTSADTHHCIRIIFFCIIIIPVFTVGGYSTDGLKTELVKNDTLLARKYFEKAKCLHEEEKFDTSIPYYKKAAGIYKKAKVWDRHLRSLHGVVRGNLEKALPDSALVYSKKAFSIAKQYFEANHPERANSHFYLGECEYEKGNYGIALEHYNQALNIYNKTLDKNHSQIATTYNNIGFCYDKKGNFDKASEFYNKVLDIHIETIGENHTDVADTYTNIGICYHKKGKFDKALEYHTKALNIRLKIFGENHHYVANSYNSIGNCYDDKGNYEKTLEYYTKALNIRIKTLGKNQYRKNTRNRNAGICYHHKSKHYKAIEYHTKALKIKLKIFGENHHYVANSYNNIGLWHSSEGNYETAIEYLNKALNIRINLLGKNHRGVASSYSNIGNSYFGKGDYEKAIEYHTKALNIKIKLSGENHLDVAHSYNNIGNCLSAKGNYDKALDQYQKALIALSSDFEDTNITSNPSLKGISSKSGLLSTLSKKAYTLSQKYDDSDDINDLELSLRTAQLAASLIDSIRFEANTPKSTQDLPDNSIIIYDHAINSAFRLYEKTQKKQYLHQAFTIAEKSKAFSLLQGIKDAEARKFSNIPDSLLSKENELKTDIAYYQKKLFSIENKRKSLVEGVNTLENQIGLKYKYVKNLTKQDSADIALYQEKLFDKKRELEQLIIRFEKEHPQYYKLKYNLKVASVEDIQKKILGTDQAFIEYFVGKNNIYIFSITKDDFDVKCVQKPKDLGKWVDDLRKSLLNETFRDNLTTVAYALYTRTASKLYELLLSDVILDYDNRSSQFIIVPDGPVCYIPFELLLSRAVTTFDHIDSVAYHRLPYLIRDYQFSYSYSATLALENREIEREPVNRKCLAFAPAYNEDLDPDILPGTMPNLRSGNSKVLPGTIHELAYISRHINGRYYTGTRANELEFKQKADKYGIIHLAMHGLADNKSPLYSKLFFHTDNNNPEDDTLYAYELYNMNISAELVVLSACETGTGKYASGEGVMSMARAFMYAGSPSVAQTMWKVDDQASATLMSFFYEYLSEGMDKSEALQKSKLRYLEMADAFSGDPFFWAGFVLNGDTAALSSVPTSWNWTFALVIIGFILITAMFFFLKRNGKMRAL